MERGWNPRPQAGVSNFATKPIWDKASNLFYKRRFFGTVINKTLLILLKRKSKNYLHIYFFFDKQNYLHIWNVRFIILYLKLILKFVQFHIKLSLCKYTWTLFSLLIIFKQCYFHLLVIAWNEVKLWELQLS